MIQIHLVVSDFFRLGNVFPNPNHDAAGSELVGFWVNYPPGFFSEKNDSLVINRWYDCDYVNFVDNFYGFLNFL